MQRVMLIVGFPSVFPTEVQDVLVSLLSVGSPQHLRRVTVFVILR